MARVRHRWPVAHPATEALATPRDDLLEERREEDGSFAQAHGPFNRYRRTLTPEPGGATLETTDYHLAIPWFGWLFSLPVRLTLRRHPPRSKAPWWGPPGVIDERAAMVLGLLAAASLAVGFLNTLFTQTVNFAADEFGASAGAQGVAGTVVRLGIVFAIGLLMLSDRVGRRRMLVLAAFASPIICALGAFAPSFAWLTATQTLGRPLAMAMGLLIGIVVVEEMPRDCRAYAISLLALAVGLGAGIAIISLPLADLGTRGWRLVYLVGLVFLVVAVDLARRLPESRRFTAVHAEAPRLPRRRFALLAGTGFLLNLLTAPASFFQNRYLKDVRGYSATTIAVFTIVTNTPAGAGVVAGGRLADVHGRRIVGAVATVGGAVFTVLAFYASGPPMWLANMTGSIISSASIPALGVYTAELFPTGRRGLANGFIAASSLAGSSVGLLVAGTLVDAGAGYGPAMTVLAVGPLLVALLVMTWYPETAHLELEQINPEDYRPPDPDGAALLAPSAEGADERSDR